MRNAGGYDIHFAEDGCSRTNGFLGVYFTDATAKGRTLRIRLKMVRVRAAHFVALDAIVSPLPLLHHFREHWR